MNEGFVKCTCQVKRENEQEGREGMEGIYLKRSILMLVVAAEDHFSTVSKLK